MVEDKELDLIEAELTKQNVDTELANDKEAHTTVQSQVVTVEKDPLKPNDDAFASKMTDVKIGILAEASTKDEKFVEKVQDNLKDAAVQYSENEHKRANFEGQKVDYESEKLGTEQQKEQHKKEENVWENRQKRRKFHFDGVKPLMNFVNITEPMNLPLLYFLTVVLIGPFLINKLWKGTIGALIAGAQDEDRSKTAKGFMWTTIALLLAFGVFVVIYLFLLWRGIDIFN